jgi:nitric oxide dioxygenase
VKRETGPDASKPDGFVSNFLHQGVQVGDLLEVGAPCGEFFLDPTEKHRKPIVLISGGVGITPLMSMLLSVLEVDPHRPIYFIHAALNSSAHAFRQQVLDLAQRHPNLSLHFRYNQPTKADLVEKRCHSEGLVDAELIESLIPDRDADFFFCGPKPFMVNIYHHLLEWGVPATQVHLEFFGPRQELERPKAA